MFIYFVFLKLFFYLFFLLVFMAFFVFFFFQAEDGIRDADVTGVQTCALPISVPGADAARRRPVDPAPVGQRRGPAEPCQQRQPGRQRRGVPLGARLAAAVPGPDRKSVV